MTWFTLSMFISLFFHLFDLLHLNYFLHLSNLRQTLTVVSKILSHPPQTLFLQSVNDVLSPVFLLVYTVLSVKHEERKSFAKFFFELVRNYFIRKVFLNEAIGNSHRHQNHRVLLNVLNLIHWRNYYLSYHGETAIYTQRSPQSQNQIIHHQNIIAKTHLRSSRSTQSLQFRILIQTQWTARG